MKIVTAAQMAELESICALSEEQLAENAGYRIAACIDRLAIDGTISILCGPGNNGADGMIAAFYLSTEFGVDTDVILAADPEGLRPIGKKAYRRLAETDTNLCLPGNKKYERRLERMAEDALLVDCLLGTGQKGPPRGDVATVLDAAGGHECVVVVDVPTGIDSDTGEALGAHVEPFLTLVLGYPKPYLFNGPGRAFAENWRLVPIGLVDEGDFDAPELVEGEMGWLIPDRNAFSNKRSSVLLSIAGSARYPGAAALCATAAARMGAGMVIAAGTDAGLAGVRASLFEAPLAILPEIDGELADADHSALFEDADAVVVGPGIDRGAGALSAVKQVAESELPAVYDGDALYHIATNSVSLPAGTSVLTPHSGEAARLLGTSSAEIDIDRFGSARAIAAKFNQTTVLKGLHPVVAVPGGEVFVIPTGTPLLASAGTGDVLAGMIGSLLAQGLRPTEAANLGCYIHGALAEIIALGMGRRTYGILASDLAGEIPVAVSMMRNTGLYPKCLELLAPQVEEGSDEDVT
jgi:NAD(P)H-hydrate epimerase